MYTREDFKDDVLYATVGGGSADWDALFEHCEDFDINIQDVIENVKDYSNNIEFNSLMYEVLNTHAQDLKNKISESFGDLINKNQLEDYEVSIYTNYLDSGYNENYEFWNASNLEEIKDAYVNDFMKFLTDENVLNIDINSQTLPNLYDKFVDEVNENESLSNDDDNPYSNEHFEKWVIENILDGEIDAEDVKEEYTIQQEREQSNTQQITNGGSRPRP